jgi:hypothetical protein
MMAASAEKKAAVAPRRAALPRERECERSFCDFLFGFHVNVGQE